MNNYENLIPPPFAVFKRQIYNKKEMENVKKIRGLKFKDPKQLVFHKKI